MAVISEAVLFISRHETLHGRSMFCGGVGGTSRLSEDNVQSGMKDFCILLAKGKSGVCAMSLKPVSAQAWDVCALAAGLG